MFALGEKLSEKWDLTVLRQKKVLTNGEESESPASTDQVKRDLFCLPCLGNWIC